MATPAKWSASMQIAENQLSFASTGWPAKVSAHSSMRSVRRWCGVNLKTSSAKTLTPRSPNSSISNKRWNCSSRPWLKKLKMSMWISKNGSAYLGSTKKPWILSTWSTNITTTMLAESTWTKFSPISSWTKKKL